MIKLALSLTEPYQVISRWDDAIALPAELPEPKPIAGEKPDAFEERAKAWAEKVREAGKPLRTARETGDYSAILKPDAKPTVFVVRQISASEWLTLEAAASRAIAKYGGEDANAAQNAAAYLIVRFAVLRLEGAPPAATMPPEVDKDYPELGPIQPPRFVDLFTGAEKILFEIAAIVGARRHTPPN